MIIYFTEALIRKTCQEGIEKRAIYKYQNFEKNKVVIYFFQRESIGTFRICPLLRGKQWSMGRDQNASERFLTFSIAIRRFSFIKFYTNPAFTSKWCVCCFGDSIVVKLFKQAV